MKIKTLIQISRNLITIQSEIIIDWNARIIELESQFGEDAKKWIYSKAFNIDFVRKFESIYLKDPLIFSTEFIDNFNERNVFNFPGPFYTVETDNCGVGQIEAPENILYDHETREHIFIQPRTIRELANVISAAYLDTFKNYGFNGNEKWTTDLIKEWWSNRYKLIEALKSKAIVQRNGGQNYAYIEYLNGGAKIDLQRYAYFLKNGLYPNDDETNLPEID